ncbi:MAG: nodulation protein NfeD [Gemmatimonadetes bacterium]|uniref:Nodulation protein NfeD n=1 Tax=Candidatus Kutchimonas denitrificans TaxID=3056748 RepID=A0AAE5CBD2_9BACT|nr:nodulation protein NfeD [Gemmatimonadota bacterium]NIR74280.1 nodulation protein NfeD [Candidatus Kutchimonas denitrificans]NIS02535.1 nodulation protein NfeD [Gemmatimonadota bacterium]NIT68411.1 nodulation protein NfeD [Gemmatimonadota bacterium]NIU51863.1 nodulation protein NfeD [Gemmatimonadota bacterium]
MKAQRLVLPRALGILTLTLIVTPLSASAQSRVHRIPIEGTIDRGLGPYVERAIEEAQEAGARFALLDINTPGGRVDAAWQIVDAIQGAQLPVYAYIDRALSAGAMIALATDAIYMRPGASLGAATPVLGSGEKASEKMVSAMRSEFRALAEARGLDPRVAEAMVDETIEVPGVVEAGQLLTLTASEAVSLGYASGVYAELDDLFAGLDVEGASVVTAQVNWAESIVRFLTNPVVAPLLLTLGFLGLLFEVKTPGFGFGGLAGLVGLGLFFGAHLIVGLAGLEELMLILGGIVLVGLEVFVIPGFGVAGALGILALGAGVVLSMLGRFPTMMDMGIAAMVVVAAMLFTGVSAYAFLRHLRWGRKLGGIFLRESTSRELGYISGDVRSDLIGRRGRAVTSLRPTGVGVFGDERVDIVSEGPWIEVGSEIEIVKSEGYRHVVRLVPAEEEAGA